MVFKTGLYHLNDDPNYNFQLNRLINWDGGDLETVQAGAARIRTHSDWKRQLIAWGDAACAAHRTDHAMAYYRMSAFFMADSDADQKRYYRKATDLFYAHYRRYFDDGLVERHSVPYEDMLLPVLCAKSQVKRHGTVLFHGGNDSYFEELFFPMLYLAEKGYDVYLFEGPGQGSVLLEQGKTFTHRWEMPVGAVLDHFKLENVAVIGVSLGGMLAPRAGAFEKRIKQIVAWSAFPHFLHVAFYDHPKPVKILLNGLLRFRLRAVINGIVKCRMKKDALVQWVFEHGMYAYGADSPYDYLVRLNDFQMLNVADQIDQDVLILHGKQDHLIDWRLYREMVDSLKNARSVTIRLFTDRENASDHCQCGNTGLALDTIVGWLDAVTASA